MMLRFLSALLVALALFFAPLAMANDGGMAKAHTTTAGATSEMSAHCMDMEEPADTQRDSGMKMDCMSACSTLPAFQPIVGERLAPVALATEAFKPKALIGIPPESETPPPRLS